jgi:magnesium-transporting ATPase (P-type)
VTILNQGFKALTPSHCHVVRNGAVPQIYHIHSNSVLSGIVIECPAEELVVGDIVSVQFGEKVPADLRIIECSNLKVVYIFQNSHTRCTLPTFLFRSTIRV